jgi:hypothetical protein
MMKHVPSEEMVVMACIFGSWIVDTKSEAVVFHVRKKNVDRT